MRAPKFSPHRKDLPLNQALALMIGVSLTVGVTAGNWLNNNALFTITQVLVISGIGGALSFALWAGRRRWLIGGLLGLIAGLGAAGAFLIYTRLRRPEMKVMYDIEADVVLFTGAGLPMVVLGFILWRDKLNSK